jgi:hypothetical protein
LKGGYWGPVRARCRPATRAHNEDFVAYQQGFRCCGEADRSVAAPRPAARPLPASVPASTPPVAGSRAHDGGGAVADLSPEWESRDQDGDELEAIGRTRVGLACALQELPAGRPAGPLLLIAAAALTAGLRRRRARAA